MGSLQNNLRAFLKQFEPYSKKYFLGKIKLSAKYSSLISQFYKNLEDFSVGGKRMRAFLVYLGYQAGGSPSTLLRIEKILPISLAFELIHGFLLIHDDIIDKSETRRGRPTIHKIFEKKYDQHYGISQAIVLGDIACFEALELINGADFDDDLKVNCERQMLTVLKETGYGEALDVDYSYRAANLTQIWQVVLLKTAKYSFVAPLTLGAILGRATKGQLAALLEFGLQVGMAFQLQDDILGVFGDEKVLGKSVLSDLAVGKNTVLIYKTRALVRGRDKIDLDRIWGKEDAKYRELLRVRQIIENSGALEWCKKESQKMIQMGKKAIPGITKDRELQTIFEQIADFVINREK